MIYFWSMDQRWKQTSCMINVNNNLVCQVFQSLEDICSADIARNLFIPFGGRSMVKCNKSNFNHKPKVSCTFQSHLQYRVFSIKLYQKKHYFLFILKSDRYKKGLGWAKKRHLSLTRRFRYHAFFLSCYARHREGGEVLPIMAFTGRLRPKGVPFRLQVYKRGGISQAEVCKRIEKSAIQVFKSVLNQNISNRHTLWLYLFIYALDENNNKTSFLRDLFIRRSYGQICKRGTFFNKRYIKGEPFSPHKRVRGWTSGRSLPLLKFLSPAVHANGQSITFPIMWLNTGLLSTLTLFVDPLTGGKTQEVEQSWTNLKEGIKRRKGVSKGDLQAYLDDRMWRQWRGLDNIIVNLQHNLAITQCKNFNSFSKHQVVS